MCLPERPVRNFRNLRFAQVLDVAQNLTFLGFALARLAPGCTATRPHLFEIVERANFRPEDVNDHVAGVDQHPIAMRHALDPDSREPGLTKIFEYAICHRPDVTVGPSRGHDHVVGDCGVTAQIDYGGILSLHVIKAREDDAKRLVGVRPHLGDEIGAVASAAPRDCNCGQRSFPFGSAALGTLPGATSIR
jgi:hypothetical protein